MSKTRHGWWGYVKKMIYRFPEREGKKLHGSVQNEFNAVAIAILQTEALPDGADRLKLIDAVYWRKSHKLAGAAMLIPCSYQTAKRWQQQFIRLVAKNFKCDSLM